MKLEIPNEVCFERGRSVNLRPVHRHAVCIDTGLNAARAHRVLNPDDEEVGPALREHRIDSFSPRFIAAPFQRSIEVRIMRAPLPIEALPTGNVAMQPFGAPPRKVVRWQLTQVDLVHEVLHCGFLGEVGVEMDPIITLGQFRIHLCPAGLETFQDQLFAVVHLIDGHVPGLVGSSDDRAGRPR
jgi:hypothetical protein